MAAKLTRLLGAFWPKIELGTIVGNKSAEGRPRLFQQFTSG